MAVETGKFLSLSGLAYYDGKIKAYVDGKAKVNADAITALTNGAVKTNTDAISAINTKLEGYDTVVENASKGAQAHTAWTQFLAGWPTTAVAPTLDTIASKIGVGEAEGSILTAAKAYVDGKVDDKFDVAGSAATAESNAKGYADGLKTTIDGYTVNGKAISGNPVLGAEDIQYSDEETVAQAILAINDELTTLGGGVGSIQTQITNAINELDVEDAAVEGQYVSSVKQVDGKIEVTRVALPDYTEVYDAKGAAEDALDAAKAYTDALRDGAVKTNADAIAVLNGTGEGSVDKKITDAFNDFATKVSDDNVVNTYKELIDYAADHGAEFTELVGVVNAKADSDKVYTKTEADGLLAAKANSADVYAKGDVDGLLAGVKVSVNDAEGTYVDVKGSVDDAGRVITLSVDETGLQSALNSKVNASAFITESDIDSLFA